ncbi:MAG: glycosyltransferase [Bacteroidia bacterium]|nr:glycosyltransferase [Bacteroidia bacterium]MBP9689517.1 glycosyltransferase [Bacteroidia bacterium]
MAQQQLIFTVTNDLVTDQRMQRICATLQHAGFGVTLVGRSRSQSLPLAEMPFKQHRIKCVFESGALFYLEFNLKLLWFLLMAKCALISAVDADTIIPCAIAAKLKNKKLVFDAHEYFTEVPELHQRNFIKQIWQTVLNTCVPLCNARYTVGPRLAEIFNQQYHKTFDVIYNMPVKKAVVPNQPKQNIVLYQGDLNIGRGIEETIHAMQTIDAELWIAGDGLLKDKITALISALNLNTKVKMLGKISPDKLHQITLQAKVGINLLDGTSLSYRYSIANKFFDYVQAKVPSVCANFEEYKTLNQQVEVAVLCANLVPNITQAIQQLLTDDLFYKKMVDNCSVAAEQWCWQTQETHLIALYKKVLNE